MREELKEILEDILEVEAEELQEDKELDDFFEWDSLAILSLTATILKKYKKKVEARNLLECVTVGELLDFLEEA